MNVKVTNDCNEINNTEYKKIIEENKNTIKKCITICIKEEDIFFNNDVEVYIRYTNNDEIRKINNEYRNIDKATDVLSFPMYEYEEIRNKQTINLIPVITLGDIIISTEKVEEQSKEYGHSYKRELLYLITHAMFHLLGYDHIEENDKKTMREKEEKIMNILEISR